MAKTIRQSIVEMLKQEQLTTFDLAEKLAIKEKEVFGHLEHIIRSLRPKNQLVIKPAQCKSCGFQFKKRSRIKKCFLKSHSCVILYKIKWCESRKNKKSPII